MRKPDLPSFSIPGAIPHLIEQDEITIPRSLFYLSCSSIFVSFILLILSLLDLGYYSLWLTPPVCLFTLIFHGGVLVLSRKKRTIEDPTYFPTVVLCGYLLTLLWLIAFILTIVVFAKYPHIVEGLNERGLHTATAGLQRFQCFLCIVDLGLVGGFTARSHVIALEEGDPEHWRVLVESQPTMRDNIRVQRPVTMPYPDNEFQEPRAVPPTPPIVPNAQTWVTASEHETNMQGAAMRSSLPSPPFPEACIPPPHPSATDELYDDYYSDYYDEDETPERRNTRRNTRRTTRDKDLRGNVHPHDDFDPVDLYRATASAHPAGGQEHHLRPPTRHYSVGDSLYEGEPESPEIWDEVTDYYLDKEQKK